VKRGLRLGFTVVCVAVCALVVLVVLLPAALGLQRYVITGGSMTGTIDRGSVVYARLAPLSSLRSGDVVTFVPPGLSAPVTHRIVGISVQEGQRVFRTKGDANAVADPWAVTFPRPVLARYAFHIPYAGYLLALLSIRSVRMVLIGLPAVVIAISLLWSLWRTAGEELRAQESARTRVQAAPTPADTE
jgi:signal peptidase I